jgi:A/G-specific adenine glycosylase
VHGPTPLPPALRDAVLGWYAKHGRHLPFRGTADPYAILVSEAMAQQTQAARAGETWTEFMARFPTVQVLAAATPADVLRAWQGLGYNRRGLNLWRAAGRIVAVFEGQVPRDLADLESLPGVGPYTARAVAAIAFGRPVGAVDTNVRRVLGRIVAGADGALTAAALQGIADAAVPRDRPGAWTHAVMDIGAMLCRPRRPDCEPCPARAWCRYASEVGAVLNAASPQAGSGTVGSRTAGTSSARAGRTTATSARERSAPFRTTSRWLRGRILDRLREAADGDWVVLDDAIGPHGPEAVAVATHALCNEGLLELDPSALAGMRARLPIA